MKILVDVLGGDKAPKAVIEGAIAALRKLPDLSLVLVGPKEEIESSFGKAKMDLSRVEIVHSDIAVLNTDHPSLFIKEKPDSSLALCFENLRKREDIDAMVSAGPTGAILTGAVLRIGRLPGVSRPALIATLPTRTDGQLVRLVDTGANMDCKSEYLVQFALMAEAYLKLLGIESPRIATLSVGQEEGKGNDLSKETYQILKTLPVNFVGNIEGDHVLKGEADLVVCDGFAGNVFIKSLEEGAYFISDLFKAAIYKNVFTMFGALFQLSGLKKVKKPFDYANKACAPLLGAKKLILKCHGKSEASTFEATILEAYNLVQLGLQQKIVEAVSNLQINAKPE
ncbi:MAG: phosphate acyltransferase PlsX [Bacilli bacterium]|nr:phosphate acyltransferase PlsX [Bacilli bacterium]